MKEWEKLYTDTCDNNRKVLQRLTEFIYNTVIAHGSSLNINNSIQYFIPLDDATISMYLHNDSHQYTSITVTYKNGYYFNYCLENSNFNENDQMQKLFLICDKLEEKYGRDIRII